MKKRFERRNSGKFEYKPVFWDPEKEEREEREKRVKEELGLKEDSDTYIPNIEGTFRNMYQERKAARKSVNGRYALRMFLVLLTILLGAFYLMSKFGEKIINYFY